MCFAVPVAADAERRRRQRCHPAACVDHGPVPARCCASPSCSALPTASSIASAAAVAVAAPVAGSVCLFLPATLREQSHGLLL